MSRSKTSISGKGFGGGKAAQDDIDWVKGHDGHPQNERCDELATTAADGEDRIVDEGLASEGQV